MTPLAGARVLDLTQLLPGPYATLLLVGLGAEVIKVEPPAGDPLRSMPPLLSEGTSPRFAALNRGKKSVVLNLKRASERQRFVELLKSADALVEGFRPGVAGRMGVDYGALKALKPDLVYCSLTGYGQRGPYRDHVGHDLNYIGIAGVLSLTGQEPPTIPGVPLADLAGGSFAALSLLAALWQRERTGQGRYLDLALSDSAFQLMVLHLAEFSVTGQSPQPQSTVLTGGYPCYNVYETADRRWLTVGCLEPKFWAALCERLGLKHLVGQQFVTGKQREDVFDTLRARFLEHPLDHWLKLLDPTRVPVGPVHDVQAACDDPQLRSRGLSSLLPYLPSPLGADNPPGTFPQLGQHNAELLGDRDREEVEK